MIVPASDEVELNDVSRALVEAFFAQGFKALHFQPIVQKIDKYHHVDIRYAEHLLSHGWINELLEEIVSVHEKFAQQADIVIVEGLSYQAKYPYIHKLNVEIADALSAQIIILGNLGEKKHDVLEDEILIIAHDYPTKNFLGCIVDEIGCISKFSTHGLKCIAYFGNNNQLKFISNWIKKFVSTEYTPIISPPLFRHRLVQGARVANKKIILPEGSEIRIIKAANICARRKIARCVLMGVAKEIHNIAKTNSLMLSKEVEIIEPTGEFRERYVQPMAELRKSKGLTIKKARDELHDNVVLAMMMLKQDEVDGIVAGATHTTADTMRPALQLIKTFPETELVSSVFFMCLPEQILVFGDCAVNINPSAEELAVIAIESAGSAMSFGIEPRVAMISYSTGSSGHGADVDKVSKATEIVKQKRPDLIIDGPLQYDAAIVPEVAKIKAPNSPVAGRASVCIFPDLDAGNTVYKAVQRTGNIISIGPMMQGLRKPVNDLSRGCLVEDVVFTIAITAVQAAG